MGSGLVGPVVRVVAAAARRENRRCIDRSRSIGRQSSRFGSVNVKACAGCAETNRCVSLTGNDHGWNPIPVGRRSGASRIEDSSGLDDRRRSGTNWHIQLIPTNGVAAVRIARVVWTLIGSTIC